MVNIERPTIALKLDRDNFDRSSILNQLNEIYDAYNAPDERQKKLISRRAYAFLVNIKERIKTLKDKDKRDDWTKWREETIDKYVEIMGTFSKNLPSYQQALESHKTVYIPNTSEYTKLFDEATSLSEQREIINDYMKTMEHTFMLNKEISRQK